MLSTVQNTSSFSSQIAHLMVGAIMEMPVQSGGDPQSAEAHRKLGRSPERTQFLDQRASDSVCV
jgi:hypothetical protein